MTDHRSARDLFARAVAAGIRDASPYSESDYRIDCFVTSEVAHNEALAKVGLTDDRAGTGALIGVGPCQNFTYAGMLRPAVALVVDARFDNLLEHLMFKVVFESAAMPLEYLAMLFGRTAPSDPALPAGPEHLLDAFDRLAFDADEAERTAKHILSELADRWSMPETHIERARWLLDVFRRRQLAITSVSEEALANLDHIPSLREIIAATSSSGANLHFLTDPERYAHVRALQLDDRVIPVLGNLTSPSTVQEVNGILDELGERASAVYLSNMEEFLVGRYVIDGDRLAGEPNPAGLLDGDWGRAYHSLAANLSALATTDDCLLFRFYFPGGHAGLRYGIHPWLEPHVTTLGRFLRRLRDEQPDSVLETYL
jgi:hypothetical protein